MTEDNRKVGNQDRARIAGRQDYEVEHFHHKHDHLTRAEAVRILKEANGDRKRADRIAADALYRLKI